jgi:hypothetical protein
MKVHDEAPQYLRIYAQEFAHPKTAERGSRGEGGIEIIHMTGAGMPTG